MKVEYAMGYNCLITSYYISLLECPLFLTFNVVATYLSYVANYIMISPKIKIQTLDTSVRFISARKLCTLLIYTSENALLVSVH